MNITQDKIFTTIFFSLGQGKNHVTYTSIDKIIVNLKKWHNIIVKRRWVFFCIRWIIDAGLINRNPRYWPLVDGLRRQKTSMISITRKGFEYLKKNGVAKAVSGLKTMIEYLRRKDGRFPTKEQFENGMASPRDLKTEEGLKKLLGGILKDI